MAYRINIDPVALGQIEEFSAYLRHYSEDFAVEQIQRLRHTIALHLGESPSTWPYFAFTGAYLFRVGRRTQYWIVYTVDDETRTVDVLLFWNAMRDPESLEL